LLLRLLRLLWRRRRLGLTWALPRVPRDDHSRGRRGRGGGGRRRGGRGRGHERVVQRGHPCDGRAQGRRLQPPDAQCLLLGRGRRGRGGGGRVLLVVLVLVLVLLLSRRRRLLLLWRWRAKRRDALR
jgi:hypothetical protein